MILSFLSSSSSYCSSIVCKHVCLLWIYNYIILDSIIMSVVFDFFFVKAFIIEYAFFDLLLASELSISLHSLFIQFSKACFMFFLILLFNELYFCKWLLFLDFSDLPLLQSSRISSVIHGLLPFKSNYICCSLVYYSIKNINVSSELIVSCVNLFLLRNNWRIIT